MVLGDIRALGIRIGIGLIEQSLYKQASLPVGTNDEAAHQVVEDAEYYQRIRHLLQQALQPSNAESAVEQEAKVLSLPQ